jgi:hypothetical protein
MNTKLFATTLAIAIFLNPPTVLAVNAQCNVADHSYTLITNWSESEHQTYTYFQLNSVPAITDTAKPQIEACS